MNDRALQRQDEAQAVRPMVTLGPSVGGYIQRCGRKGYLVVVNGQVDCACTTAKEAAEELAKACAAAFAEHDDDGGEQEPEDVRLDKSIQPPAVFRDDVPAPPSTGSFPQGVRNLIGAVIIAGLLAAIPYTRGA